MLNAHAHFVISSFDLYWCRPPPHPTLRLSPNFPSNIVLHGLRVYWTGKHSGFKFRMFLIPTSLISDAPVFVAAPADRVGDAGERIELECRVDSNPSPQYSWIRNDLPSVVSSQNNVLTRGPTWVSSAFSFIGGVHIGARALHVLHTVHKVNDWLNAMECIPETQFLMRSKIHLGV